MALETSNPDVLPGDLNLNWPTRDDLLKEGDDHIRLTKLAAFNLQVLYEQYFAENEGRFNEFGQALVAVRALEADSIKDLDLSNLALKDGTYPDLRAQATTAEDVGLGLVANKHIATNLQDNDDTYVLSSLLYSLYYTLQGQISALEPPDLSNYARINGTYPYLRAQATTKEDVGLGLIEDYPISQVNENSDVKYASARSVYVASQEIVQEVENLVASASGSSGAQHDGKDAELFIHNGIGSVGQIRQVAYRTYSMSLPTTKTIFSVRSLKVYATGSSGTTPADMVIRYYFRTSSGVLLSPKYEVKFTVLPNTDDTLYAVFSLGEELDYQSLSSGKYGYNFELYVECEKLAGDTTVFSYFGYGESINDDYSLLEFAAPSNLISFT